jgi:hypothetical protein
MARDSATLNLAHFSVVRDDDRAFQQLPSYSAKAEYPVFKSIRVFSPALQRTGSPACAGDDDQDQPFRGAPNFIIICARRAS